jgi:hypothetical protein
MSATTRRNRHSHGAADFSDTLYDSEDDSIQSLADTIPTSTHDGNSKEKHKQVLDKNVDEFKQIRKQQQRNPVLRRQNTFSLPSSSTRAAAAMANRPVSAEFTTPQHERRRNTARRKDTSCERLRPLTSGSGPATTPTVNRRRRPLSDFASSSSRPSTTSADDFRRNSHSSCHHSKDASSTPVYAAGASDGSRGRRTVGSSAASGVSSRRV